MMKVFYFIVFGYCVKVFYKELFEKYGEFFDELGVNLNNGLGSVYDKILILFEFQCFEIECDINKCYVDCLLLVMVNLDKGIFNLYVLSDVIVDVLMLVMICNFGQMWGLDGKLYDIKVVILESIYVIIYQEVINFCKIYGVFDLIIMGIVFNVGLMVQKVEEYGFYDKMFEMEVDGIVQVVDQDGNVLIEYEVEEGDIWCMCQVKDVFIQDWVKLVVICVC